MSSSPHFLYTPVGNVYFKPVGEPDGDWQLLGTFEHDGGFTIDHNLITPSASYLTESAAKSRKTQILCAVLIVLPAIASMVWWLRS